MEKNKKRRHTGKSRREFSFIEFVFAQKLLKFIVLIVRILLTFERAKFLERLNAVARHRFNDRLKHDCAHEHRFFRTPLAS